MGAVLQVLTTQFVPVDGGFLVSPSARLPPLLLTSVSRICVSLVH